MTILILGMGHVGKALAQKLKSDGHRVVGTTTTAAKVEPLSAIVDEVFVLRGSETEKVAKAAADCDQIVVTVAPDVKNTRTVEERHAHYREVLVESCHSAALTGKPTVFLSSFSVYGDGGDGTTPITEESPTANHEEPSSRYYQQAEQEILSAGNGCVLRFPDMYGAPGDLSFPERVKLAHTYFGGKTLFGADALLYAIHFEDVVEAVYHGINNKLRGIFNVCDDQRIPATNKEVFDAICAAEGLSMLEYLNQIKAPQRKISAEKLYRTGYCVKHSDPNKHYLSQPA
ncbi:NAD-dependent epimerase/dehydratase family protein [Microbulbifer bruguierae]|uniref:NAD-dependent epimerase/dehydratase family protein n=1 Tax=Microbulbifer bruguierae TaxID=3029061 RepID=A0ABY8ND43_9GAMM|nr:NAD-dependent epimerase/dehydratase family protein [Microbulbifer bruguierae]WGL16844.1 NAD-dependent epimerase/dehydratase family protein [Microbulbifer bruguierae]